MVLLIKSLHSVDEHLMLMLTKDVNKWLSSIPKDLPLESYVVCHFWKTLFVEIYQMVERSLTNVQGGQTRQEIISNEEAEEDEIIDDSLDVKSHFHLALKMLVL